jgi:hypothetical protein
MLMCKLWVVLSYFDLIDVWHAYIHLVLEFNEMDIPCLLGQQEHFAFLTFFYLSYSSH